MIRALIVDDEPLSVTRLTMLLGRFPDVEIAATAQTGGAALKLLASASFDVIFLDVEMPDMDGFDLLEALATEQVHVPLIVFVTAFPRFAADAFDTGAVDFLTKPIRLERVERAVKRVRDSVRDRMADARLKELLQQLEQLRNIRSDTGPAGNYLWVQRRGEAVRLDLDKLERVAAEGEYVRLFVEGREYLHRESVTSISEKLDRERFVRVHRSHIVRRDRIISLKRRTTGSHALLLEGGETVPVGRRYRQALQSADKAI